jgi:GAF domain-containing protein
VTILFVAELAKSEQPPKGGQSSTVQKLFQSLLLLSHITKRIEREWQLALVNKAGELQQALCRPSSQALLGVWDRDSLTVRRFTSNELPPLDAVLTGGHGLNYSIIRFATPAGPFGSLFQAVILGHSSESPTRVDHLKTNLADLSTMIHASEAVVVHRGLSLARRVDQSIKTMDAKGSAGRLRRATERTQAASTIKLLSRLCEATIAVATSLTRSSFGDLCLTDKEPSELYVVAHCENPGTMSAGASRRVEGLQVTTPFDKFNSAGPMSVVPFVYSSGQPFFVNDLNEFSAMHPRLQYQSLPDTLRVSQRGRQIAELAVPITIQEDPLHRPRVIGVLNLEKKRGIYGLDDLMIARTLAQHFCLRRLEILSSKANESVGALTMAHAESRLPLLAAVAGIRSGNHPELQGDTNRWPIEFEVCRGEIQQALRTLYEITTCTHVTVRLLNSAGSALHRFAEHPAGFGKPGLEVISLRRTQSSVNAWVAAHAKPCYIPNVDNKVAFRSFSGLKAATKSFDSLKSEYCAPIVLQGRVIGTIDLESKFVDAFGGDVRAVDTLVKQVSLALRSAQRAFEHELILANSASNLSVHEILKCSDQIETIKASAPSRSSLKKQLSHVQTRLLNVVERIRSAPLDNPRANGITLSDLVTSTCSAHHVSGWCKLRENHLGHLIVDPTAAHYIALSLGEILDNAFKALSRVREAELGIWIDVNRHCSRSYVSITVTNPLQVGQTLPIYVERRLFRVPFNTDRWHLGAYLAGLGIRSLGGDIRLIYKEREQRVDTCLEIPRAMFLTFTRRERTLRRNHS